VIFGGEEADAEEGFQVVLDESLERFLYLGGTAFEFGDAVAGEEENFYIAH